MTVVTNTGPLIALAKADRLDLLEQLFGQVQIPSAVYRELLAGKEPDVTCLDKALARFIKVEQVSSIPSEVLIATLRLDRGEQQAIALAYELGALLVMDDQLGRAAARRLRLPVTGLIGVLIQAKQAGLILAVIPLLDVIRQRGYWLSNDLLQTAARLAGETIP